MAIVFREYVNIGSAGTSERTLTAPAGYRVVTGYLAAAEDEDGNYQDIDFHGSYPVVNSSTGVLNAWRFQWKNNAATALWLGIVVEPVQDQVDLHVELPGVYV